MIKVINEITRDEWIALRWVEVPQTFGDPSRIFSSQGRRTPDEAYQAMDEWDATEDARNSIDEKGMV